MLAHLDHLVVTAGDLDEGIAWVQERLGVKMEPGGQHDVMATHNALLHLGDRSYLEVIALDLTAEPPDFNRWFDLDYTDPTPRLATWVARTSNLDASSRAARYNPGPVWSLQRNGLHWRISIPHTGELLEDGLLPLLIEWGKGSPHPTDRLRDAGCEIEGFEGGHPEPDRIIHALRPIGLDRVLTLEQAEVPWLRAQVRTPDGLKLLD